MVSFNSLLSILAVAGSSLAVSNPGDCSGICGNSHDPSIIIDSAGKYWRFSTGGKIAIHTAPSLTGPWEYNGAAIPNGSIINLDGKDDLWAPEVIKVGDTYYMFYSVSSFGSQASAIGVATSKTLGTGSWQDLGRSGVSSKAGSSYNAIDASLTMIGSDYYMTFGSFWKDIYQVKMTNPPTKVASGQSSVQVVYNKDDTAIEGASLFKNGKYYYMFYSQGQCCGYDKSKPAAGKEYRIKVCRSETGTGDFVDQNEVKCTLGGGTLVLGTHDWVYGPGGQGVYNDPKYGPVLYYHYVDTRIGFADGDKKMGWNQLDFSSGWPVVK
ncbi:putative arabinan endo-1 5-alpha-L-arabinosidase A [Ceratocystis platani]|uniref:Arabinan endo-1,5-alpha-L-arabinosidase n=1 Tax=Ceratocystis fimbriata f. sp. platani TaxID=88771 RepID=A0A0F8CMV6_CERFI|nr:putative arabinan endo-1 5-alpha-L-arabinosidase A [Ceratocystis platani]